MQSGLLFSALWYLHYYTVAGLTLVSGSGMKKVTILNLDTVPIIRHILEPLFWDLAPAFPRP